MGLHKLAVIIPSAGRPHILHDTVLSLNRQTVKPVQIIVSVPTLSDVLPETTSLGEIVCGERGASTQRNRGINMLGIDVDLVTFLDDDIELRDDYLAKMIVAFESDPSLLIAGGCEIADGGIARPSTDAPLGISREDAQRMLKADESCRSSPTSYLTRTTRDKWDYCIRMVSGMRWLPWWLVPANNMTMRRCVLEHVRFDTRLPLYSFMEDYDFCLAGAQLGRVARVINCRMVHLGASGGHVSPRRLGFAQVMNPIYIWNKRRKQYPAGAMLIFVARILAGNIVKFVLNPRERWERLQGNLVALSMIARGELRPERMIELDDEKRAKA
jgi:GT2 family glycosyltransferase